MHFLALVTGGWTLDCVILFKVNVCCVCIFPGGEGIFSTAFQRGQCVQRIYCQKSVILQIFFM